MVEPTDIILRFVYENCHGKYAFQYWKAWWHLFFKEGENLLNSCNFWMLMYGFAGDSNCSSSMPVWKKDSSGEEHLSSILSCFVSTQVFQIILRYQLWMYIKSYRTYTTNVHHKYVSLIQIAIIITEPGENQRMKRFPLFVSKTQEANFYDTLIHICYIFFHRDDVVKISKHLIKMFYRLMAYYGSSSTPVSIMIWFTFFVI